jgi:hypothetical protein
MRPAVLACAAVALLCSSSPALAQEAAPVELGGPVGRTVVAGPWTLRMDAAGDGMARGWAAGRFTGPEVATPYVPNAATVTGDAGLAAHQGGVAWYRTTLELPEAGHYALRFESVHHHADVWLDGRLVARHDGVYLPFEARFEGTPGPHTLVVRADWRDPKALKRAGWHRTWFNFGGINREVTLRRLRDSEIATPFVHTRLAADGSAIVDVSARVRNLLATREITLAGALRHGDQAVAIPFPAVRVPSGAWRVVRAEVRIPRPALWAPGAPSLYDFALQVPGGGATWVGRTGLRELTWRGGRVYLNGRRLILRGASLHEDVEARGDALTGADMDELVADLERIGANATRSQHQLSPALVERLDAAGILVWMGVGPVDAPGSWTNRTAAQRRRARERVRQSVKQLQYHPSIVAWNLANEVAGNGHPGGLVPYVDDMARELHATDPGRLVALDVWGAHPPKRMGALYRHVDAVGATNYVGWYESPGAPRPKLAHLVRQRLARFQRIFAGKVLVISEFGAEASAANPTRSPGGFEYQLELLATHLRAYKADPQLSGMLVWALRDFAVAPTFAGGSIRRLVPGINVVAGINEKGLFTRDNRAKPAVKLIGGVFGKLNAAQAQAQAAPAAAPEPAPAPAPGRTPAP